MLRRSALLVAAALVATAAPHATAARTVKLPVVAVIDSGVRATHQEFDYRGRTSTTDQFVAWWDFTTEVKRTHHLPGPGQLWDTQLREPYDKDGHGTLTASMVGGRNAVPQKTRSSYPGAKLAIAKVANADSVDVTVMANALRWAVDTVKADVISMSIGSIVPLPAIANEDVYSAISYARSKGVLVVVSNGNGWGGAGVVPGDPGWASNSSASPDALSVGAKGSTGLLNSTDPEVAAVYVITGPSSASNNGYVDNGGTSFGTPYVAGFAAQVILATRQANRPMSVAALEQFLKDSSTDDSIIPPQFEGYGVLGDGELVTAVANAKAGKRPTRPSPDVSALYVDGVAGTLRALWTGAT